MTDPDVSSATRMPSREPQMTAVDDIQVGDEDRLQKFECMSCGNLQDTDTKQCTDCGGNLRAAAHSAHHVVGDQIENRPGGDGASLSPDRPTQEGMWEDQGQGMPRDSAGGLSGLGHPTGA